MGGIAGEQIADQLENLSPQQMCIRDRKNPEDAANSPHELTHAPDALRGFCSWWVSPAGPQSRRRHDLLADDFRLGKKKADPLGRGDVLEVI